MKEKIYFNGEEISIGTILKIDGINIEVTEDFIKLNPQAFVKKPVLPEYVEITVNSGLFKQGDIIKTGMDTFSRCVFIFDNGDKKAFTNGHKNYFISSTKDAYDRHQLYKEAKKRYVPGVKLIYPTGRTTIIDDNVECDVRYTATAGYVVKINGNEVYIKEKWVKALKPLITTEDGVVIYEGDDLFFVNPKNLTYSRFCFNRLDKGYYGSLFEDIKKQDNPSNILFSSEKKALEYIDKHTVKDLQYFENKLLNSKDDFINLTYKYLKEQEPSLYYTKLFDIIYVEFNGDSSKIYDVISLDTLRKYDVPFGSRF